MNDVAAPVESFRRVGFEIPGGRMAGIAFGAEKPTPDIVFLHATGFNARTYRALLEPLGEKFYVVALDARGHGLSTLPPRMWGYTSWRRHRDDLIAVLEHFTAPVTLAGHSMGATVSLLTAGKRTDLVAGLALLEPVILSASGYAGFQIPLAPLLLRFNMPLAAGAMRRRARFESREAAMDALTGRGVFKPFPPEVVADYVADGLVEDDKGGFKLACAPKYEAATYCAQRHDPWEALRKVTIRWCCYAARRTRRSRKRRCIASRLSSRTRVWRRWKGRGTCCRWSAPIERARRSRRRRWWRRPGANITTLNWSSA